MQRRLGSVSILVLTLTVAGCGRDEPAGGVAPDAGTAATEAGEAAPPPSAEFEPAAPAEPAAAEPAVIDPADLHEAARVEIREYQVAFIGSGTLGKGTLRFGGAEHPFRIGGLGIGGIGVAKIDADGTAYNLERLEDFAGVYGNARLGATAGDEGAGRLWLRNDAGVVLELHAALQGLALTGGVDGVVVTWEQDYQDRVGAVKEGTQEVWEDTKAGTQKAYDKTVEGTQKAYQKTKDAIEGAVD